MGVYDTKTCSSGPLKDGLQLLFLALKKIIMRIRIVVAAVMTALVSIGLFSFTDPPCSILKKGKFKYLDVKDKTAYLEIKDNKLVEYYQSGKYFVKSDIKWLSACVYEATMTQKTLPDNPYKAGDKLKVEVQKIKNDTIFYKGTIKGSVWQGKMLVMK